MLLSHNLLGVPLGSHWLSGAGVLGVHGVVFLGVLAVLAAACWLVARAARRALPQRALAAPAAADAIPGARALGAFGKIAPYITVVIAAFAPLAGVIYLITSTGWSAAERLVFAARAKPAATEGQTASRDLAGAHDQPAARGQVATGNQTAKPAKSAPRGQVATANRASRTNQKRRRPAAKRHR